MGLTRAQFAQLVAEFGKHDAGTGRVGRRDLMPLLDTLGLFDRTCHRKLEDLATLLDKPDVSLWEFVCWWTGLECDAVTRDPKPTDLI